MVGQLGGAGSSGAVCRIKQRPAIVQPTRGDILGNGGVVSSQRARWQSLRARFHGLWGGHHLLRNMAVDEGSIEAFGALYKAAAKGHAHAMRALADIGHLLPYTNVAVADWRLAKSVLESNSITTSVRALDITPWRRKAEDGDYRALLVLHYAALIGSPTAQQAMRTLRLESMYYTTHWTTHRGFLLLLARAGHAKAVDLCVGHGEPWWTEIVTQVDRLEAVIHANRNVAIYFYTPDWATLNARLGVDVCARFGDLALRYPRYTFYEADLERLIANSGEAFATFSRRLIVLRDICSIVLFQGGLRTKRLQGQAMIQPAAPLTAIADSRTLQS